MLLGARPHRHHLRRHRPPPGWRRVAKRRMTWGGASGSKSGGLVADLGCGPGRYLIQLGNPVLAVDVSRPMLSLVARYGHPRAQADLESLPFAEGVFAGAFARHSYLHPPKASALGAFAELRRVLAPGGLVLLSLVEGEYEGDALPEDDFPGRYFASLAAIRPRCRSFGRRVHRSQGRTCPRFRRARRTL